MCSYSYTLTTTVGSTIAQWLDISFWPIKARGWQIICFLIFLYTAAYITSILPMASCSFSLRALICLLRAICSAWSLGKLETRREVICCTIYSLHNALGLLYHFGPSFKRSKEIFNFSATDTLFSDFLWTGVRLNSSIVSKYKHGTEVSTDLIKIWVKNLGDPERPKRGRSNEKGLLDICLYFGVTFSRCDSNTSFPRRLNTTVFSEIQCG